MSSHALPALFTLFAWWFSTGAILYLDGLPRRTWRWSMLGASVVLVLALFGLRASGSDSSVIGAYCAFSCALLAWGWVEMAFLMGFITGPRKRPSPPGTPRWRQALHATQAILWHELAILGIGALVVAVTWGQANQVGTWTFVILAAMRASAKLNLFLGVRNKFSEFLPEHLRFLEGFFGRGPINLLFPVSVTVGSVVAGTLLMAAGSAEALAGEAAGYSFLGILLALAVLEHWFMVLPLPSAVLWNWSLGARAGGTSTLSSELVVATAKRSG